MVGEGGEGDPAAALAQVGELGIGPGGADPLAHVEAGQGAHPVDPLRVAEGAVVRELEVAPGLHGFGQEGGVVVPPQALGQDAAIGSHDAQAAACGLCLPHIVAAIQMLPAAPGAHQGHEQAGEVAEAVHFGLQWSVEESLEPLQCQGGGGHGLRQVLENLVAVLQAEGAAHPARHGPGAVDLAPGQALDDPLAELPQADAGAGQLGLSRHQAEHIAPRWIAVPAQQEVGAAQVKEGEGMALADLGQVEQAPELGRRRRNAHRQQAITGAGRRQQVAHRADAADPRGDRRHLLKWTALAEPLETAELRHVEAGLHQMAVCIELEGDAGVPLDAGHGIDCDRAGHPNRSPSGPSSWGNSPRSRASSTRRIRAAGGGQPGSHSSTAITSWRGSTRSSSTGSRPGALGIRGCRSASSR